VAAEAAGAHAAPGLPAELTAVGPAAGAAVGDPVPAGQMAAQQHMDSRDGV
jgi:hypothetical protein